jgi:hypothetical protein
MCGQKLLKDETGNHGLAAQELMTEGWILMQQVLIQDRLELASGPFPLFLGDGFGDSPTTNSQHDCPCPGSTINPLLARGILDTQTL